MSKNEKLPENIKPEMMGVKCNINTKLCYKIITLRLTFLIYVIEYLYTEMEGLS